MASVKDFIEYEFVLPDGTKRYELVDTSNDMSVMQQINLCMKMHGAVAAHPVQPSLFDDTQFAAHLQEMRGYDSLSEECAARLGHWA